jgi:molybdopterin-containing oxidoreductase family molybdopterin binding subunit
MEEREKGVLNPRMTRRSFVKASAVATAATGAVLANPAGSALKVLSEDHAKASESTDEKIYQGVCSGNCGAGCAMNVHVRNGKVRKTSPIITPLKDLNRLCMRGYTHVQRIYDPNRIKYPMRRVGKRGEGKWERISWDEAISEICSKWKEYQSSFGKTSIAFSSGSGNYNGDIPYVSRLINMLGATTVAACYDDHLLGTAPNGLGYDICTIGNDMRDLPNAKNIFVWGSNPTESGVVFAHFLLKAQEEGAKLVVIDPNYTVTASKADKFVPIRPGTDGLLAIAMMQIIINEGLQDEEFMKQKTVAPYLVKESDGMYLRLSDLGKAEAGSEKDAILVRGKDGKVGLPEEIVDPVIKGSFEVNGQKVTTAYDLLVERISEWTLKQIAEYCEISEDTIYELAHMYADGPSTIYFSYGPDHYANGHTFYYNAFALAMVSGNLAKPGAGFCGSNSSIYAALGADNTAIVYPPEAVPGPQIKATKLLDVLNEKKYGDMDLDLKSLYVYIHNPIANQTDRKAWLEAFEKLEFIVVADVTMGDTTKYADIVLPVPHFFEVDSFSTTHQPYVRINEKAVDPPFECKGDFEITNLLGAGMGMEEYFSMTREEYLTAVFDNDLAKAFGVSWENLKKEKYIYAFPEEPFIQGQAGFNTATGRAQFYMENIQPNTNYGQEWDVRKESLPYWEPPFEAWFENDLMKKYPFIYTSERSKYMVHTQYSHVPWLKELMKEPFIFINNEDAKKKGIKDGDTVKVFNDRGYVVVKAALSAGVRPGVLVLDHGWQEDQFIEGHYQDLTSRRVHPAFANNNYFDALADIKKI